MELAVLKTRKTCKTQYLILGNHGTLSNKKPFKHSICLARKPWNI